MNGLVRWLASVGLLLALLCHASTARATLPSRALPFDAGGVVALAPGKNADEVVVVGSRARAGATGASSNVLTAAIWSVVAGRVVREAILAETEPLESVRAVRAGDRVFVVTAPMDGAKVRLFELDDDLRLLRRAELGEGAMASLVVTDAYVIVSAFVSQTPVVSDWKSDKMGPPSSALHVRVLSRRDMSIAGARIFRGEMLLDSHAFASIQTVAAVGDHAFVTIPENFRCTIARLRLPSLAVEAKRTFETLEYDGNMVLTVENGRVIAERNDRIELSPSLELRRRSRHTRWAEPFEPLQRTTDILRVRGRTFAVGVRDPDGAAAITWKGR